MESSLPDHNRIPTVTRVKLYGVLLFLAAFPTRRSSDLHQVHLLVAAEIDHRRLGKLLQLLLQARVLAAQLLEELPRLDRKSTRLNSSHSQNSYAVFCLKKKTTALFDASTSYRLSTHVS